MSEAPDWLVARPIAHRGLHARTAGVIENSIGAARAAIAAGCAIECDVQLSLDGEAMVFHDATLTRLTGRTGAIAETDAKTLAATALTGSRDTIPSLRALLDDIAGRAPLILEIKSRFDGDTRLTDRTLAILEDYGGPVALKSFDPRVVAHARTSGETRPLGIVAMSDYEYPDYAALTGEDKHALAHLLHFSRTRPDFLSWRVDDLPSAAPFLCRSQLGRPVMTWTVRTPGQAALAKVWADQIVFEGAPP